MPNNIVKSFAEKTGKSVEAVEKLWDQAKIIAKKEYPKVDVDSEQFFKIVTGILKNSLGLKESQATITTGSIPIPTDAISIQLDKAYKRKKKKQNEQDGDYLGELEFYLED